MRTRAGFEALLVLLEPWIKSTSIMLCPSDPQGAAQEARSHIFVRVFRQKRVDVTKSPASIANFLRSAVRNVILNEARRGGRNGMNCISRGRNGVPGRRGELARPTVSSLSAPMRNHRQPTHENMQRLQEEHTALLAAPEKEEHESKNPFPIPYYAEYYAEHGNLTGAAKYCETKYGYDAKKTAAEFERVMAEFKKRLVFRDA